MPKAKYGDGPYGEGPYGTYNTDIIGEEEESLYSFGESPFGQGPFGGGTTAIDDGGEGEEDGVDLSDNLPETAYFGGGKFGQGLFAFSNEQMVAVRNAWDSGGIELHPESNTWALEAAITTPLAFISDDCVEVTRAHHIDTAVDGELDLMGELQNVERNTGESDAAYRLRIKAAFRASATGTTFSDVLEFITSVLQVDPTRIGIDPLPSVPGTAKVSVYQSDLDNALISAQQLAQYATKIVAAGHRIIVQVKGTFTFDDESIVVPPEKGFSSDTFVGGTLSESLDA